MNNHEKQHFHIWSVVESCEDCAENRPIPPGIIAVVLTREQAKVLLGLGERDGTWSQARKADLPDLRAGFAAIERSLTEEEPDHAD